MEKKELDGLSLYDIIRLKALERGLSEYKKLKKRGKLN
jgi:hypothetical protein